MDRNSAMQIVIVVMRTSLSARRAWIEIPAGCWRDARRAVALRKESVDRNGLLLLTSHPKSGVALRKESVDRNVLLTALNPPLRRSLSARRAWIEIGAKADSVTKWTGRSPQGERG